jgi:hypothetical protein
MNPFGLLVLVTISSALNFHKNTNLTTGSSLGTHLFMNWGRAQSLVSVYKTISKFWSQLVIHVNLDRGPKHELRNASQVKSYENASYWPCLEGCLALASCWMLLEHLRWIYMLSFFVTI